MLWWQSMLLGWDPTKDRIACKKPYWSVSLESKHYESTYRHESSSGTNVEDSSASFLNHVSSKEVRQGHKRDNVNHDHTDIILQFAIRNLAMSTKAYRNRN